MLSHQHIVTASKLETNQSMNQMIAQVIHMCVLPVKKIWHFNSKFDQHLSLYCGSLKPKLQMGIGYWFLWDIISKFTENVGNILQKYT